MTAWRMIALCMRIVLLMPPIARAACNTVTITAVSIHSVIARGVSGFACSTRSGPSVLSLRFHDYFFSDLH